MKALTKSNEDYLEAILVLGSGTESVKSIRIAEYLSVSRPAVNKAMNELFLDGLVEKSDYSDIILTAEGLKKAGEVYKKHVLIKEFLKKIGVSEETAEIDCCKIEHVVSDETITKMIEMTQK